MLVSENHCLALAADFTPEGFLPWRDALTSVISKRAYVVEEYDASVASPSRRFRLPAIIARRSQSATLHRPAAFTRANVFLAYSVLVPDGRARPRRAAWKCALCGEIEHDMSALTFEHVVPRSRGGLSTWSNIALAHASCNHKKGARTLAEAGLTLHVPLRRPTNRDLATLRLRTQFPTPPQAWRTYLDLVYWTSPIDP